MPRDWLAPRNRCAFIHSPSVATRGGSRTARRHNRGQHRKSCVCLANNTKSRRIATRHLLLNRRRNATSREYGSPPSCDDKSRHLFSILRIEYRQRFKHGMHHRRTGSRYRMQTNATVRNDRRLDRNAVWAAGRNITASGNLPDRYIMHVSLARSAVFTSHAVVGPALSASPPPETAATAMSDVSIP